LTKGFPRFNLTLDNQTNRTQTNPIFQKHQHLLQSKRTRGHSSERFSFILL